MTDQTTDTPTGDTPFRITVPPGEWTVVGTREDLQLVIEVRHANEHPADFEVALTTDPPTVKYVIGQHPAPADGYRMRAVPMEQYIADEPVDAVLRPVPSRPEQTAEDLVANHPAVLEQDDARAREALAVQVAFANGWVTNGTKGTTVRLTDIGRRYVERLMGLPEDALE